MFANHESNSQHASPGKASLRLQLINQRADSPLLYFQAVWQIRNWWQFQISYHLTILKHHYIHALLRESLGMRCFPSNFDPIFVPQDKDVSNCVGSAELHHSPSIVEFDEISSQISCCDVQSLSELSIPKSPPALLKGSVTTLNMDVLEQTVLHVQNQLLTHLESMNTLGYKSMTQVVESTFIVLDRLLVNYTPFQERVKEFIACASSFADIEQSINNKRSFQDLLERLHSEKVRYDDIFRIHNKIMTAFTDSNHRLQSLREEASCVKELLLQIGNQLSSCEAETKELETHVGEVSRDMLESQKSLQTASQEAEEATKLCHQREQKRNAAKATLEKP